MTTQTTKEQALEVLKHITHIHANEDYFKKAEVVWADIGHGVDMWVDGPKWRSRVVESSLPPVVNRVPICVLMVG
jgi:hypothetical protein